jgi:hypothetical protein
MTKLEIRNSQALTEFRFSFLEFRVSIFDCPKIWHTQLQS